MTDSREAQEALLQFYSEKLDRVEQEIRDSDSDQHTCHLRMRQAGYIKVLALYNLHHVVPWMMQDAIQGLIDAESADRRPKHYGYTFNTYDSADAAFIRSYLRRNREEHADAQG